MRDGSKKVLLTTPYTDGGEGDLPYDHFYHNTHRKLFRNTFVQINAPGLRFIKENVPEVDILEYPSWQQFCSTVRDGDYDVVGFSFFMHHTSEALEMADAAREMGVDETWAGNYGALTPEIQDRFDRVFVGYAERDSTRDRPGHRPDKAPSAGAVRRDTARGEDRCAGAPVYQQGMQQEMQLLPDTCFLPGADPD